MDDPTNVISLTGAPLVNERRERFVQAIAASFDNYVEVNGYEPDAVVYVLCGVKQASRIAWDINGDSADGPTSILAIAAVHCQAEAAHSRQGIV